MAIVAQLEQLELFATIDTSARQMGSTLLSSFERVHREVAESSSRCLSETEHDLGTLSRRQDDAEAGQRQMREAIRALQNAVAVPSDDQARRARGGGGHC